MKTKNILWPIIVIIIAIGLIYYLNQEQKTKLSPSEVSQNFYKEWIGYKPNPIADKIYLNSPYLSEDLKNKISETVESFDEFGAYDPVLCAQEKPSDFQIDILNEDEKFAIAEARLNYFGQERIISLELIKEKDKWYIDQINCPQESINNDELAIEYIENNISSLSPEPEVLGGTFYVTNIEKIGNQAFLVEYEDGHIALSAELEYELDEDGEIIIYNFNIID